MKNIRNNNYKYNIKEKKNQNFEQQQKIDNKNQSLHYSHETLMHLLSAAENFAGLNNKKYEKYNISIATDHEELKSEFIWEIECFKLSKKAYEEIYGEYDFPSDLSKEKILFDIYSYIINTKIEKDKILYYVMAYLINGININNKDIDKLLEELDKYYDKNFDLKKYNTIIEPIKNILNKNAEGQVQKKRNRSKSFDIEIQKKNKKTNIALNAIIGERGYLINLANTSTSFIFESESNHNYKSISVVVSNSIKKNNLYECLIDNKSNGYFYLLSDIYQTYKGMYCILFDEKPQKILEKYITLVDNKNNIGIYQIDSSKEKKDILIVKNEK